MTESEANAPDDDEERETFSCNICSRSECDCDRIYDTWKERDL